MKMQTILFGIIIVIVSFYFIKTKFLNPTPTHGTNTSRPTKNNFPKQEIKNDKLVVVENVTSGEVDSILNGFCNMYNNGNFQAILRTYKISERQFAITFPYDMDFQIYCYLINYIHYPMGFDKSFQVTGWTTIREGETWTTDETKNKEVLLFIPEDDAEHDNVYLTTSDNVGFKLGFATGEEKQLLSSPKKPFASRKIKFAELANKEYKDYK